MRAIHYFSPWLKSLKKYQKVWWQIESSLNAENELFDFIPNAADIWVRDFMPFQRNDEEFVIYRYNPDYLQGKNSRYITNCRDAFLESGGSEVLSSSICHHTNLIIDGGNIIKCKDKNGIDCVIMTTKVLYENPTLSHHEILLQLEELFNAEVVLIPWDINERYGHADGMVRSIAEGKLLLNCYSDMDPQLGKVLRKILSERFDLQELQFGKKYRENSWCHLNYLELRNALLVPIANIASDRLALQQIEKITGKKCIPISMSSIIADGGAMHCISWTMNTQILREQKIVFTHPIFYLQCH